MPTTCTDTQCPTCYPRPYRCGECGMGHRTEVESDLCCPDRCDLCGLRWRDAAAALRCCRSWCPGCGALCGEHYLEDACGEPCECCRQNIGASPDRPRHPYHWRPSDGWRFYGANGEWQASPQPGRTYFGAELEYVGSPPFRLDILRYADPESHHFADTEDSSVRGEIVTHPGTLAAWRNGHVIPWEAWETWRRATGAATSNGAGFHIHVGRGAFRNARHLYDFHRLLTCNPTEWETIGRRSSGQWAAFRWSESFPSTAIDRAKGTKNGNRYLAVNHRPDNTIELRFPRSTLRQATILGTLELVHAAIRYTAPHRPTRRPDFATFAAWMQNHAKTYREGLRLAQRRGVIDQKGSNT